MADITASMIKELRERTQAGMLDCKKALAENDGDMEKAAEFLRKKGLAAANKKAGREAKEGIVAVRHTDNNRRAIMVELNCETDFVAKNDGFKALSENVLDEIEKSDATSTEVPASVDELVKGSIGTIGENMGIGRFTQFNASENGVTASYIHSNSKIGVIVEIEAESADGASKPEVLELGKEVAMQAAAAMPQYLDADEIPADVKNKEKEIFMEQMRDSGKPENILEKIVEGKLRKYFSEVCLVDQEYIKDSSKKVSDLVKDYSSKVGETLKIKGFARIHIGA